MRRREFITLIGGGVAVWPPLVVRAQQAGKIYRMGFLGNDPTIPTQTAGKAFVEVLRENGFDEGKNIVIERRFAEGNARRQLEYAAELVGLNADVILASGSGSVKAAKQTTNKIPIVMANVFDPVGLGFIASLNSPGGNITGVASHVSPEIAGKRLELLKLAVPAISHVAVVIDPDSAQDQLQWNTLERAARSLKLTLNDVTVRARNDLESAFAAMRRDRPDALFGLYNSQTLSFRRPIVAFANENRLPSMFAYIETVEAGGLMSYGASRTDGFKRAAVYVARILKGAKPSELPVEQPTKFEFAINLKSAKTLGIEIPSPIILLADEVIE